MIIWEPTIKTKNLRLGICGSLVFTKFTFPGFINVVTKMNLQGLISYTNDFNRVSSHEIINFVLSCRIAIRIEIAIWIVAARKYSQANL